MRFGTMAAVVGLLLALCVPARAESSGRQDEDASARAKAKARPSAQAAKQEDHARRDCAARQEAGTSQVREGAVPSDTLVVAAGGPDKPGFTMVGESVTYDDPTFVPYKLREAARRARASVDISTIP
jgi:hypothetical protein